MFGVCLTYHWRHLYKNCTEEINKIRLKIAGLFLKISAQT